MSKLHLFTDCSADPKTKIGFGAFVVTETVVEVPESPATTIQTRRFRDTTPAKLELQTLLWAISELPTETCSVIVYTDSQTIANLPKRRERLETEDFKNSKGVELNHHQLYREFYAAFDRINLEIILLQGHKPSSERSDVEAMFAMVDKASRRALRDCYDARN